MAQASGARFSSTYFPLVVQPRRGVLTGHFSCQNSSGNMTRNGSKVITFDPKVITFAPILITFASKLITFTPKVITFGLKLITFGLKVITFDPKVITFTSILITFGSKLIIFALIPCRKHPVSRDETGTAHPRLAS
jgi:hypothetical protein